jgi:hypothetical protein
MIDAGKTISVEALNMITVLSDTSYARSLPHRRRGEARRLSFEYITVRFGGALALKNLIFLSSLESFMA